MLLRLSHITIAYLQSVKSFQLVFFEMTRMKRWNCGKLNGNWCVQACIEQAELKCCPKHGCPSRCSKLYCRSIYNLKSPDRCYSMLHGTQIAQRCNNILIFICKHLRKDKGSCTKISLFPKAFSFVIYTDIIFYSYIRFHVLMERRSRLKKSTILLSNFMNKQFYLNNG